MIKGSVVLLAAALLSVPAVALAQEEMAHDHASAIAEANASWSSAFNAGDASALAALYFEDAVVMAPGAEPARGHEAIQALFQGAFEAGAGASIALESLSVEESGDVLVDVGRYVVTAADGSHADHGSYVAAYRRMDGQWKMFADIWNSSMPPAGGGM